MFGFIGEMIGLLVIVAFSVAACMLGAFAGLAITEGILRVGETGIKAAANFVVPKILNVYVAVRSWYDSTTNAIGNGYTKAKTGLAKVIPFRKNGETNNDITLPGGAEPAFNH